MEQQPYFKEVQRFWDVLWIKLLFLGIIFFSIYSTYADGGADGLTSGEFLSGISTLALVTLLFYFMKLEVSFDQYGINYRFFPFHLKTYSISWQELDVLYIRRYSPLGEYGGWGIRFGLFGAGTAYNVAGNIGLQVQAGKRKILFGTKKPGEMEAALQALFHAGTIKGSQLSDGGIALVH